MQPEKRKNIKVKSEVGVYTSTTFENNNICLSDASFIKITPPKIFCYKVVMHIQNIKNVYLCI